MRKDNNCFVPSERSIEVTASVLSGGKVGKVSFVDCTEEEGEVIASCDFSFGDVYYVASPLSAPTYDGIVANAEAALDYADKAKLQLPSHSTAYAPHAYLYKYEENYREEALEYGMMILKNCKGIVVCGDVITKGMAAEIAAAEKLGLPIYRLKHPQEGLSSMLLLKQLTNMPILHILSDGCRIPEGVSQYRVFSLSPLNDRNVYKMDGLVVQNCFKDIGEVKSYLAERNAKMTKKDSGMYRVEGKDGDGWMFIRNLIISTNALSCRSCENAGLETMGRVAACNCCEDFDYYEPRTVQ